MHSDDSRLLFLVTRTFTVARLFGLAKGLFAFDQCYGARGAFFGNKSDVEGGGKWRSWFSTGLESTVTILTVSVCLSICLFVCQSVSVSVCLSD